MNNILAAQVLRSHLPEITDGAYKRATKIAIEQLYSNAIDAYYKFKLKDYGITILEHLAMTQNEYDYWIMGMREI